MNPVYIVAAVRTPMGSFGGILKPISATELGSIAISGALGRTGILPELVNEVLMGNVCQANLGQAPARQAALKAGLPNTVPCTTVNKVCSSGMKAVMFGAQSIMLGMSDIIVAGGMESMSNIPYYAPGMRWGSKFGSGEFIDGLQKDGLSDAYDHKAMGLSGDATAKKYGITREEQDAFAIGSYKKAATATHTGKFKNEIVPVKIKLRKGGEMTMTEDEEYKNVIFEKISTLRPAFSKEGTVTAANASTINDGASAIMLVSEKALQEYKLTPLARIVSFADAAHEPSWFTTAPVKAAPLAIERAGLTLDKIDLFEVNEAFSVVPMAFSQDLDIDPDRINIHGGAVALGHPLGSSGSRIIATLVHALHDRGLHTGCATLCNGGGGASAVVIERV